MSVSKKSSIKDLKISGSEKAFLNITPYCKDPTFIIFPPCLNKIQKLPDYAEPIYSLNWIFSSA
jgi:hypothetical protein